MTLSYSSYDLSIPFRKGGFCPPSTIYLKILTSVIYDKSRRTLDVATKRKTQNHKRQCFGRGGFGGIKF